MESQILKYSVKGWASSWSDTYIQLPFQLPFMNSMKAEGKVRSYGMKSDITLLGVIPYQPFDVAGIERCILNKPFFVTPYMIRFHDSNSPIMIYKNLKKACGQKYILNDLFYSFSNRVFSNISPHILNNSSETALPINGAKLLKILSKEKKYNYPKLTQYEFSEDAVSYIGQDEEWELTVGRLVCVTDDFICLCSYMNSVSGKLDYVLLPPEDVYFVLPEDKASAEENTPSSTTNVSPFPPRNV